MEAHKKLNAYDGSQVFTKTITPVQNHWRRRQSFGFLLTMNYAVTPSLETIIKIVNRWDGNDANGIPRIAAFVPCSSTYIPLSARAILRAAVIICG
jgi:hypothetical protein